MKNVIFVVAFVAAISLSACADHAMSGQSQPQSKEVTRMANGTFVTYSVPANQSVPGSAKVTQVPTDRAQLSATASGAGSGGTPEQHPRSSVAATPVPVQPTPLPSASPAISEEAATELGEADVAVRSLQIRLETAQAALQAAHQAAALGDSTSALRHARTAIALSRRPK